VVAGPVDGGLDVGAEQAGQNCGERGVAGLPMLDSVLAESAGQGKGLGRCTRTPPEAVILRVCSPTRVLGQAATFHGSSWLAGSARELCRDRSGVRRLLRGPGAPTRLLRFLRVRDNKLSGPLDTTATAATTPASTTPSSRSWPRRTRSSSATVNHLGVRPAHSLVLASAGRSQHGYRYRGGEKT
jgi:hypothetical protein